MALEDKEGGLHEFPEHLASRMPWTKWLLPHHSCMSTHTYFCQCVKIERRSREANVHPAVLMPFLLSFNMSGEPNSMPEATAA